MTPEDPTPAQQPPAHGSAAHPVPTWQGPASTTYRFSKAHGLRIIGPVFIALGLGWIVTGLLGFSPALVGGLLVVTVVAVACFGWLMTRPPRVLVLDTDGYAVHNVRGKGVAAAVWSDVESVQTLTIAGTPSVVFELGGDRTSVVPLTLLGERAVEAQRETHARLNTAFGYRSL